MKKIFCTLVLIMLLSLSAFAGSIPEDLLHSSDAQVFFAEVIAYHPDKENPDIEVSPTKKIKGDIIIGTKQVYYRPNTVGDFEVKAGNVYLFAYFDENNPTEIFEVTNYDTRTLKLKNVQGDMWERFEEYLNNGEYEAAEQKRIDKINSELEAVGEQITLLEFLDIDKKRAKRIDDVEFSHSLVGGRHEIDEEDFVKVADKILLTDVENTPMADSSMSAGGIYITVTFENGSPDSVLTPKYAFISEKCQVDNYNLFMSRFPMTDYIISASDYEKLINLTYDDEDYDMILYIVIFAVAAAVMASAVIRKIKSKKEDTE